MAFNSRAGGKGSAKRPTDVSMETFDSNFDRIFGKKSKPTQEKKQELTPETIKKALEDSGILYMDNDHFYGALMEGVEYDEAVEEFIRMILPSNTGS